MENRRRLRRTNSKRYSWVNPKYNIKLVMEEPADGERPPNAGRREVPDGCICQRPKKLVLCSVCGFQIIGRVRTVCSAHPQTIFLMDLERCPQCLGNGDILKEYPLD